MRHFIRSTLALAPLVLQAEGIRTASFDLENEFDNDDTEGLDNTGAIGDDDRCLQQLTHGEQCEPEELAAAAGGGGGHGVHTESCDDFSHDLIGLLERLQVTFDTFSALHNSQLKHESTADLSGKIYEAVADELKGDSLMVTAHAETAHRKHCLDDAYRNPKVQVGINSLLDKELDKLLAMCETVEAPTLKCREAYSNMVRWQHAILQFSGDNLFEELGTSDIKANCPKECSWCSRQHRSKYKKNQPFKFKCFLNKDNAVPSEVEIPSKQHNMIKTKIKCEKPRRRTIKFWRKKTWCEVEVWKRAFIRRHKVAAMFSCSSILMAPSLQDVETSSLERAHKTCMRVEQGMAVNKKDMDEYEATFKTPLKETVSNWEESVRWATRTIINLGMNAGMGELIHRSSHASDHAPGHGDEHHGDGHHSDENHHDDGHHALLEGDPHGDGGHAPAGQDAIAVFQRDFPATGGEHFFNDELDDDDKYEVCHIPPRKWRGFFGVLSQFFRQALRLPLMALGIVFLLPVSFLIFGKLLMLAWRKNFFLGVAATAGSPLLLALALAHTSAVVFVKVGKLLRIADWDCDPSMVVTDSVSECTAGMYWRQTRSLQNVKLQCLEDYKGTIVYE